LKKRYLGSADFEPFIQALFCSSVEGASFVDKPYPKKMGHRISATQNLPEQEFNHARIEGAKACPTQTLRGWQEPSHAKIAWMNLFPRNFCVVPGVADR